MSRKTSLSGLADEIVRCLNDYSAEVERALEETKEDLAEEAVERLKKTSPRDSGKYRRNWKQREYGHKRVVYNAKHYRLTHLLEKGHVVRNRRGGRALGRAPAIPHIKPAEEYIHRKAEKAFERNLK